MATLEHYRNKLLQSAPIRVLDPSADKSIMLFPDDRSFKIDILGIATPSVIHFTAKTINIPVFPTFSVSEGGTLTNVTNTTCELTFNNMVVDSVKVYAKVTFEGIEYVAEETIKKIVESERGPGAFYVTGDSWSDSAANAATLGPNKVGDIVTISNGMSYVELRRWNGVLWEVLEVAVDGGKITLDSITASMIKDGIIDTAKFASGIEPIAITNYIPLVKTTSTIFYTVDSTIYTWDETQGKYTTQTFNIDDLEGQLTDAHIQSISASKVTGQLTNAQIAAVDAAKLTGSINNATLPAGQINGQLTNAQIAAIDGAKVSGALINANIGAAQVQGQLTNEQIAAVDAAKLTGSINNATLPAGQINGQLVTSQIQDGAILHDKIAANAVYQENIAAGAITARQLAIGDFENLVNCGVGTNIQGFSIGIQSMSAQSIIDFNNGFWGPIGESSAYQLTWEGRNNSFGQEFPVQPGDEFFFSMLTIPNGGGTNNFEFSVGFILTDYNGTVSFPVGALRPIGTNWAHKATGTIVIPAYISKAKVFFLINANDNTNWSIPGNSAHLAGINVRKRNGGSLIVDGSIVADKIATNAITSAKIAANSITADKIVANTITAGQLAAGTITANELAVGSVTTYKIAAGSIIADRIAADTITGDKLAANTISTNKLLVTGKGKALNDDPSMVDPTAWIVNGSGSYFRQIDSPSGSNHCFTAPGAQTLESRHFPVKSGSRYKLSFIARVWQGISSCYARVLMKSWDGTLISYPVQGVQPFAVPFEDITLLGNWAEYYGYIDAPSGATTGQISITLNLRYGDAICDILDVRCEEYIGADLIVDGAISARHIAANTITAAQIAAGAITADQIATNAITTSKIAANSITADKLVANSITAGQLAAGTITANELAAGSVTTAKIAAGAVTADQIAANAITAAKIQAGAIEAGKLAAGSVVALNMTADSIYAAAIAANQITADKLAANSVVAGKVAANAITAGTIAAAAINSREIAAGAITTDKLAIISRGMALNSDVGPSDYTAWDLSGGANISNVDSNTGSFSGNTFIASGTITNSSVASEKTVFPITAGKTYRLSLSARSVGATESRFYARIARYNASMVVLDDMSGMENIVANYYWQTFTSTFVAEANAVVGRVQLYLNWGTSGDNSTYVIVQNVRCEEVLPGTLIENGAITTVKIAAAAITADQIAANAVTADKIVAGAITAGKLAADSVTANSIAAGAITASKITTTDLASINSNLGAITAGSININNRFIVNSSGQATLSSANTGSGYTVTDNAGMRVYDGNNVLRVRIGIW